VINSNNRLMFAFMLAVLGAVWGCSPSSANQHIPNVKAREQSSRSIEFLSNDRNYRVVITPSCGRIDANSPFDLRVSLRAISDIRDTLIADSISFDAEMPQHYHGMNSEPHITRASDDSWDVNGIVLHMKGSWQLYVDISAAGLVERAQYELVAN